MSVVTVREHYSTEAILAKPCCFLIYTTFNSYGPVRLAAPCWDTPSPLVEVPLPLPVLYTTSQYFDEQNQCSGPGIFIPDPDFFPYRISDTTTTPFL
jgi:hypothetical protein